MGSFVMSSLFATFSTILQNLIAGEPAPKPREKPSKLKKIGNKIADLTSKAADFLIENPKAKGWLIIAITIFWIYLMIVNSDSAEERQIEYQLLQNEQNKFMVCYSFYSESELLDFVSKIKNNQ